MSSPNNSMAMSRNSRLTLISFFVGFGLILFVFESLIPRPLPWLKLGFGHVATLLALYQLDGKAALIVVILRIILGSLILGTFLNPSFLLSLSGGIAATLAMIVALKYFNNVLSIFGISTLGSVFHNVAQLVVANWLIVHQAKLFYLLPFMILTAIFTGLIIAFVSSLAISGLNRFQNQGKINE